MKFWRRSEILPAWIDPLEDFSRACSPSDRAQLRAVLGENTNVARNRAMYGALRPTADLPAHVAEGFNRLPPAYRGRLFDAMHGRREAP